MSETTQTTLDWRYLPELPPEPAQRKDTRHYLVASDNGDVHRGWYRGNGEWAFWGGGEVYAWAIWPDAPPAKGRPQ